MKRAGLSDRGALTPFIAHRNVGSTNFPYALLQAWFPKAVVVLGITLAIWAVLLFPLDTANRHACSSNVPASYCTFTIPAMQLWYSCFIANAILTFVVIPFAMFYYEADSEL